LQRGLKNWGKEKKRNKSNKRRRSKNKRGKNHVTGVLAFTVVLNKHPWIPKIVCPKNLAMVDNNHPFKLT
jgi:hypothetical protein